jgi:hypothetical protein
VEAKLLQIAASLRTFFVAVIFAETLESFVRVSGVFSITVCQNIDQNPLFHAGIRGQ